MKTGELFRHILSATLTVLLLIVLMSHYAHEIDQGEVNVWLWMATWGASWIFVMWAMLRDEPLKLRHYATACALALAFLALTCSHELIARYWISFASTGSVGDMERHLAGIGQ